MTFYINSGVNIKCSYGSLNGLFLSRGTVWLDGMPVATIMDHKPGVNIGSCGMCRSLLNPSVASATAAAFGMLTPMPCVPVTTSPWAPGKTDFMIGGKPALLNTDKLMCAWGGIIQIATTRPTSASVGAVGVTIKEETCPICGKKKSEHKFKFSRTGDYRAVPATLGNNMIPSRQHPWGKENGGDTIQAHHLISGHLMRNQSKKNDWSIICDIYGYDINKKENGVYLPGTLAFACHLRVPLHFSNHGSGFGGYEVDPDDPNGKKTITYNKRLELELNNIQDMYTVEEDDPCPGAYEDKLVETLDKLCKTAFDGVESYEWTITFDAVNYKPESLIGCANQSKISDKQNIIYAKRKKMEAAAKKSGTGIVLSEEDVKYIRAAREDMLKNHLPACTCNHSQQYPGITPKQTIKYGGTY